MKILKILLLGASLLPIGFLLIPVFVPTLIVETRIVVNKPAAARRITGNSRR